MYLHAARRVYQRLYESGTLNRDFSKTVRTFGVETKERLYLTKEDVQRVFAFVNSKQDPRLVLIFTLLYYQGLRQRELLSARIEDYNATDKTLHVLGKGADERRPIHLHPISVQVIEYFLSRPSTQQRTKSAKDCHFLYSRKRGADHITSQQLGHIIRAVHKKCGVSSTPHAWRATFVSELIRSQRFSMAQIQKFSRHKHLGTLQRYYDNLDFLKSLPDFYQALREDLVRMPID
jgi:integrase/recombinase XerD